MTMCTVAEVRAIVDPRTIEDPDITDIISHASNIVSLSTGASTESTDTILKMACIHQSAALVLQKMKFSGELASQIKVGSESQSNNVDEDIAKHEEIAQRYMKKYRYGSSRYSIPYGRAGIKTVNHEA
ncbi:MAG: hypothetical protein QCH31_11980 [Methanolobus sp.]|nr:hypothetical protein [Methanolobus sp.]